jgi:dihydroceramidase
VWWFAGDKGTFAVEISIRLCGSFLSFLPSHSLYICVSLKQQGVGLVGIGSFFFHATLLFEAQLADELPMIYVGSMSLFLLFDNKPGFGLHSTRSKMLIVLLVLFDVLFTWS